MTQLDQAAPITIVSGLPRSGTSLMMQMLARGGLEPLTDGMRHADEDNPRGYYELEAVKRTKQDPSWLERARGRVVKVISQLLQDMPENPSHRYQVVFMRRGLDEVLRSQRTMLERRGERDSHSDQDMKQIYASHLEDVEAWLRARHDIDVLFVSYNRLMAEPRAQTERVARFLSRGDNAGLDVDAMLDAVDPTLYRNRKA